jgi:hypothetical protein
MKNQARNNEEHSRTRAAPGLPHAQYPLRSRKENVRDLTFVFQQTNRRLYINTKPDDYEQLRLSQRFPLCKQQTES